MTEPVTVMILARAPIPGQAKTRLIAALGPDGAARLQELFIRNTVEKAVMADIGPVVLWVTPDTGHPIFAECSARWNIPLLLQPEGDLGFRMFTALASTLGPALVIGTDCPALMATHLQACADSLKRNDAVFIPAEDGGYVLVGMRNAHRLLFDDIAWSTPSVMAITRQRLETLEWRWEEPTMLWDVDNTHDLTRLSPTDFQTSRIFDLGTQSPSKSEFP